MEMAKKGRIKIQGFKFEPSRRKVQAMNQFGLGQTQLLSWNLSCSDFSLLVSRNMGVGVGSVLILVNFDYGYFDWNRWRKFGQF